MTLASRYQWIETVSDELLREADESVQEEPDPADWQKQEWEIAKRIVTTDCCLKLPDKFDIHEWAIMRDFAHSLASDSIPEELPSAIHGTGAFRHFKTTPRQHRVESAWFTFRTEALNRVLSTSAKKVTSVDSKPIQPGAARG
jgi:hypothetical protein